MYRKPPETESSGCSPFKMPNSNVFSITKATGGENIDDVIMRFIKFKKNKNKIYVYMEENTKDEGGNEDD